MEGRNGSDHVTRQLRRSVLRQLQQHHAVRLQRRPHPLRRPQLGCRVGASAIVPALASSIQQLAPAALASTQQLGKVDPR